MNTSSLREKQISPIPTKKRLNEELEERIVNQTNITFGSFDLQKDGQADESKPPGIKVYNNHRRRSSDFNFSSDPYIDTT